MREHNYFSYSFNKKKQSSIVDDISDEEGWEKVRDAMITNVGLNRIPVVFVEEIEKDGTLSLVHEHDGRDLEMNYARKVFEHIKTLWRGEVKLITVVEDEIWEF